MKDVWAPSIRGVSLDVNVTTSRLLSRTGHKLEVFVV